MTWTRAVDTAAGDPRRAARPPKRCRHAAARRAAAAPSPGPSSGQAGYAGPAAPDADTPQLRSENRALRALRAGGWARFLPSPSRTPFTFGYALLLVATGTFTQLADPDLVRDVLAHSSTDVANLAERPVLVLVASGAWLVGGLPYILAFLVVLSSLERRLGALRTAGVFLLGHVLATLLTELFVAASVAAGQLPDSSLRRLDYGISYGLLACAGALAGLLRPWLRWTVLGAVVLGLVADLLEFTDPLTDWGHLLALAIGVLCWPLVRRAARRRDPAQRREPGPSGRAPRSA
ncbi:rhomboid-like protein [Streptomyces sp. NPDC059590]|uniref:rhomboid-like protein n=1 Tax=Streptomyces sp. NPDC059590 TaxID=3346877 RepID=UPI0036CCBE38